MNRPADHASLYHGSRLTRRDDGEPGNRRRQRGLTLMELMISLLISSLLIGLVFAIYTRMSVAYRGQSGVSELQQTLQSAKSRMVKQIREAGHLIPNGFFVSTPLTFQLDGLAPGAPIPALRVFDDADGPSGDSFAADKIRVFYADTSAMSRITAVVGVVPTVTFTVDDADDFQNNDIAVVVAAPTFTTIDGGAAEVAEYKACLIRITAVTPGAPGTLDMIGDGYINDGTLPADCDVNAGILNVGSMIYRLEGRSYRIDPTDPLGTRRQIAVLQESPTGEIENNDWQDLAVGFTDLQVARRYRIEPAGADADGDGDALYDWYSSEAFSPPITAKLVEVSLSLVVRTNRDLNAVPTSRTPGLSGNDAGVSEHNNRFGNSPSFDLAGTNPTSRPLHLQGTHIYRWASVRIDLRNMGVGF